MHTCTRRDNMVAITTLILGGLTVAGIFGAGWAITEANKNPYLNPNVWQPEPGWTAPPPPPTNLGPLTSTGVESLINQLPMIMMLMMMMRSM